MLTESLVIAKWMSTIRPMEEEWDGQPAWRNLQFWWWALKLPASILLQVPIFSFGNWTQQSERHGAVPGEGHVGVRDRACTRGRWTWNGLPRAVAWPRAAKDQRMFEDCSQPYGLGGSVWSQELDPMILAGPFQLGYSMTVWHKWAEPNCRLCCLERIPEETEEWEWGRLELGQGAAGRKQPFENKTERRLYTRNHLNLLQTFLNAPNISSRPWINQPEPNGCCVPTRSHLPARRRLRDSEGCSDGNPCFIHTVTATRGL